MSDRVRMEDGPKRVRAFLGGRPIADSTNVKLVWEVPYYPTYYFPAEDVDLDAFEERGETTRSPSRGEATRFDITVGESTTTNAAYRHLDSPVEELRDLVAFDCVAVAGVQHAVAQAAGEKLIFHLVVGLNVIDVFLAAHHAKQGRLGNVDVSDAGGG